MHAEHCLGGDFSYYIYWCCSQHCRNKGWRVGERRFYLWWYHRVEDCACITCSTIRLCPSIVGCTHAFLCIPFPSGRGRYTGFQVTEMIKGLFWVWNCQFLEFVWVGRFGKYFFGWLELSRDFLGGFKTAWRFVLKKPRSSWVSRVLLEWLPDVEKIISDGMMNQPTQAFNF